MPTTAAGTRAQARFVRMSARKVRPVLDLVRGKHVVEADEILRFTPRAAAREIRKVLRSAVANAEHNDSQRPDELFVAACYADEGPTLKRFRPRARGRATRINKRTAHITVVVDRLDTDELDRLRARRGSAGRPTGQGDARRRRVAASRGEDAQTGDVPADTAAEEAPPPDATDAGVVDETAPVDTTVPVVDTPPDDAAGAVDETPPPDATTVETAPPPDATVETGADDPAETAGDDPDDRNA